MKNSRRLLVIGLVFLALAIAGVVYLQARAPAQQVLIVDRNGQLAGIGSGIEGAPTRRVYAEVAEPPTVFAGAASGNQALPTMPVPGSAATSATPGSGLLTPTADVFSHPGATEGAAPSPLPSPTIALLSLPSGTGGGAPAALPSPNPTQVASAAIRSEYPQNLELGESSYIRVVLLRSSFQNLVAPNQGTGSGAQQGAATQAGAMESSAAVQPTPAVNAGLFLQQATALPVGTPSAPIDRAFGEQYKPFVTARLAAAGFDVTAVNPDRRALDQDQLTWEWNIQPKSAGDQYVNLNVSLEYDDGNNNDAITRDAWETPLHISVNEPAIALGQFRILDLATVVIGTALSIPWLSEQFFKWRKGKKKDPSKEETP